MLYQFNLSFSFSLLFMGFLFANLFGIITSTKNIVFVFILCIELINCFVYTQNINFFKKPRVSIPFSTKKNKRPFSFQTLSIFTYPVVDFRTSVYSPRARIRGAFRSWVNKFKKEDTYTFSLALSYIFTILNFLKIGFEFGFFVDAFKLGS